MEVQITGKNLEIDSEMRQYAESKLNKLSKYLGNISAAKLELIREKSKSRSTLFAAQVTLNVNGFLIRGEQRDNDIHATIHAVADVMERLITKYKGRYEINKGREAESIRKSAPAPEGESENGSRVAKT